MIRVSVMICFYFKAEVQAAFWKQTEMLLGAEGARALEFSIWEQRSSASLVLLPPLHSQPHQNLTFQVSATLLTIMRLLGRVEAAKYLVAVSKGFRNISWAILTIFPSPLLPSSPPLNLVKGLDAKSGHSCHMNMAFICFCHCKADYNDYTSCILP